MTQRPPGKRPSLRDLIEAQRSYLALSQDDDDAETLWQDIRRIEILRVRIPEIERVLEDMRAELTSLQERVLQQRGIDPGDLTIEPPSLAPIESAVLELVSSSAESRAKRKAPRLTSELTRLLSFFPDDGSAISLGELAVHYKGSDDEHARGAARTMILKLKELGLVDRSPSGKGMYFRSPPSEDKDDE